MTHGQSHQSHLGRQRLRTLLLNLPFRQKILLTTLSVIILMTLGSIIGFRLLFASGNQMLYDALKGQMDFSAYTISERLNQVVGLSQSILADSSIQNQLSYVKDHPREASRNNLSFETLQRSVTAYQRSNPRLNIRTLTIYNPSYPNYSNRIWSNQVPSSIHTQVISGANQAPGVPFWYKGEANRFGLFLGRNIRRTAELRLDTLGILEINIDLKSLISDAITQLNTQGRPLCLLYEKDELIYHDSSESALNLTRYALADFNAYGVKSIEGDSFFYVCGRIDSMNWDYVFLLPYASIETAQQSYIFLSVLSIIIALIVGLVLAGFFTRTLTTDFNTLLLKMKAFGRDKVTAPSLKIDYTRRNDEISILHQRFDEMAKQIQTLIDKNYVSEILRQKAELKSLEDQINPHFLYNTLESINWQAKAIGAANISTMVEALGKMLRHILSQSGEPAKLVSELELVENYMTIIKLRYGARVTFLKDYDPDASKLSVPKLLIQPLVENAVRYALEESTDHCIIQVHTQIKEQQLCIQVANSGSQFPESLLRKLENKELLPHGFGIGLLNIRERLALQYEDNGTLTLTNEIHDFEEWALVTLTLPIESEDLYA